MRVRKAGSSFTYTNIKFEQNFLLLKILRISLYRLFHEALNAIIIFESKVYLSSSGEG